jgi:carotenoid 1,2-hydratase
MTLIAFIGSVFSPYYAWAKAPAEAENFCAMNVALYGFAPRWAMTERRRKAVRRRPDLLQIGPSSLRWDGARLIAEVEENCTPIPRRLRGTITLTPGAIQPRRFMLDEAGRHRWRPIAPEARIEVAFTNPSLTWSGRAYFDTNDGDRPLGDDFLSWHWSRTAGAAGSKILYDVTRRDGGAFGLALEIDSAGVARPFAPPPEQELAGTLWRVARRTRADAGYSARVIKTLEDAPFYARSHILTKIGGVESEAIHESLSLDRFSRNWVRVLLPFRMPRV